MDTSMVLMYRKLLQSTDTDTLGDPIFDTSPSATAASMRRPLNSTSPFDFSISLTILVLITALFFMGFFSAYIRRFSASDDHPSPSPGRLHTPPNLKGELDLSAVKSLPLVAYCKAAKHRMTDDCAICLSEFQERENVKLIPYCGHVFHPQCVDTWLSKHVTCPLCRSAQLFKRAEEVCLDSARDKDDIGATEVGVGSNAPDYDAWRDLEDGGMRRI